MAISFDPRGRAPDRLGHSLDEASELWQAELFATSSVSDVPNRSDVREAAARIRPHARVTPVLPWEVDGRTIWLKLEHTQRTGSFKLRGALNAVLSLRPRPSAIVAASGGNHGLGVCFAAQLVGASVHLFVPGSATPERRELLRKTGAELTFVGTTYAEADAAAREFAASRALPFVHAFAQKEVIAGQGTLALELVEQTRARCDAVLACVRGGGLLAGIAVALAGTGIRVVGVEPRGAPTMHRALAAGESVEVEPRNLAIAERLTEGVVLVDDAAIQDARRLLWAECRLLVEPAAAAPLAALLSGQVQAKEPCVVLCGGNTPLTLE